MFEEYGHAQTMLSLVFIANPLGTESIRTQVNPYLRQFVLILVNSYSVFGQFVLIKFSQLGLILDDSYSVWSIRTHTKNMILMIYIILHKIDR